MKTQRGQNSNKTISLKKKKKKKSTKGTEKMEYLHEKMRPLPYTVHKN